MNVMNETYPEGDNSPISNPSAVVEQAYFRTLGIQTLRIYAKRAELFIDMDSKSDYFTCLAANAAPRIRLFAYADTQDDLDVTAHNWAEKGLSGRLRSGDSFWSKVRFLRSTLRRNAHARTFIRFGWGERLNRQIRSMHGLLMKRNNIQLLITNLPGLAGEQRLAVAELTALLLACDYDVFFLDENKRLIYKADTRETLEALSRNTSEPLRTIFCAKKGSIRQLLFFSHSCSLGGAERCLLGLVHELSNELDCFCTVVMPCHEQLGALLQESGGLTLPGQVRWWCRLEEHTDPADYRENFKFSTDWLEKELPLLEAINPDVVISNTIVIPWGALAAQLLCRPHLWSISEFGVRDHGLFFYLGFKKSLQFITLSASKILTISNAVQKELFPGLHADRIDTIYPYIEVLKTDISNMQIDHRYFKNPTAFHLLLSGTISKPKGQEDAVRAVIDLYTQRGLSVELLLVGYDEPIYKAFLEDLITQNSLEDIIHIEAFVNDVFPLVAYADAVLVCSRHEAFGRVCLEAQLMGKVVIGTDSGGIPEMISDGVTGLLYSPGNYSALADKIEMLIEDPALRLALGEHARGYARQAFSKEKYAPAYLDAIDAIIGEEVTLTDELADLIGELAGDDFLHFIRLTQVDKLSRKPTT